MMWAFGLQQSAVEQLLDRGDFTVEEFLCEDDVIQEVKSLNRRVIEYIQQPDVLRKVVEYAVGPPPPDLDQQRAQKQQKLSFQANEVLQTESFLTTIADDPVLLDMCFSFLTSAVTFDATRASLSVRLIIALLAHAPTEVRAQLSSS